VKERESQRKWGKAITYIIMDMIMVLVCALCIYSYKTTWADKSIRREFMLLGVSFGSSSILFVVGGGGKWVFVFHFVISFLWKLYKSLYQVLKVESKCSHVLIVHSLAAWPIL
jgi:Ca2+/Na+ antiporter